jgi:hypothetical protein
LAKPFRTGSVQLLPAIDADNIVDKTYVALFWCERFMVEFTVVADRKIQAIPKTKEGRAAKRNNERENKRTRLVFSLMLTVTLEESLIN